MDQREILEYKQKADELTNLCSKLKNELVNKESYEYDQEIRLKELRAELKELSETEEKLKLANRNARVLEEENNALLQKLKAKETGEYHSSATGGEALKLIEENGKLLNELQELNNLLNKASHREKHLEQKLKNNEEHQERLESQIASLKKRNAELEERIHEEHHQLTTAKEMWESQQARYIKDYEELLTSVHRFEEASQQRESRDIKDRGSEHQLQLSLLKEDITQLEEKLRLSEERCRSKERELWKLENVMQSELNSIKGKNDQSGNDVYRVFQDQLDSFKQEVTALRGERRISRSLPDFLIQSAVSEEGDEQIKKLQSGLSSKESHIDFLEKRNEEVTKRCTELFKENEQLREENDRLNEKCYNSEEQLNEKDLKLKEVEFFMYSSKSDINTPETVENKRVTNDKEFVGGDFMKTIDENKPLIDLMKQYKDENDQLRAERERKDGIYEARLREQQREIEQLLRQVESLRQRSSSTKNSNAGFPQEGDEFSVKQTEQNDFFKPQNNFLAVELLSKEKNESVEDLMRVLESAWTSEDEIKRQLKKSSRQSADFASMLCNNEQKTLTKDEELRKYTRYLNDMDEQRQKDLQRFQNEKEILIERSNTLEKDSYHKDKQIQELKDRLSKMELCVEEYREGQNSNMKENGQREMELDAMKSRVRTLEEMVPRNGYERGDISKDKDRHIYELQDQVLSLRDTNDGLWKQLATLQEEQQEIQGRLSSGRTSKTPRGSTRRRSTENFFYSQPSTQISEEKIRTTVADGAHLAVTVVELSDVLRNGRPITEAGYIVIKVKSVKEKYKTSVKEFSSVMRFDETFVFYLAQPDQDVITLHVFYKTKSGSREYHIGDVCFSMATLYRGVPRQRIALVAQSPGSKDARRAGQVEVIMQSDDFGRMMVPSEAEIEDERQRFSEFLRKLEISAPERLHAADVHLAAGSNE